MRTFIKSCSGRVWKLVNYKDLEINDIVSLHYGPGRTIRGLYKVKKIENSIATLTTSYNIDVEYDIERRISLHILNPDIKEEWINNFNKKAILNF